MKRLIAPFLAYIHLGIIISLLAVTVPHVALLVEQYEQPGFWGVAWAFALATEVAIAVTAFLLGVTRERQRMLCLVALAFFGVASALFNAAYFLGNGAPLWLAGTLGAFIPVAVALLAYLGGTIGTVARATATRAAIDVPSMQPVVSIERPSAQIESAEEKAYRLVRVEGKPVREVAQTMSKSVSQVYRYLREDNHEQ